MIRALGLVSAVTFLVFGCSHTTFQYEAEAPLHLGEADAAKASVGRTVEGEATDFVWASCPEVNRAAMKSLVSNLKPGEEVTDLEWLDQRTGQYSGTPICRTETGWVWSVYVFWWPMATKVAVRGKVTTPNVAGGQVVGGDTPKVAGSNIKSCQVEKTGDKFDAATTYSSFSCASRGEGSYAFLRAFVANGKKSVETYQVYAVMTSSDWPRLYSAAIVRDGKAKDIEVEEIDTDVDCKSSVCVHTVQAIFEVPRDDLEYFAKQGSMEFKLKGRADSQVLTISGEHLSTFLRTVPSNLAH